MVPLRTGRVFCAVAWAVSEGSNRLSILWSKDFNCYSDFCERRSGTRCFAMSERGSMS